VPFANHAEPPSLMDTSPGPSGAFEQAPAGHHEIWIIPHNPRSRRRLRLRRIRNSWIQSRCCAPLKKKEPTKTLFATKHSSVLSTGAFIYAQNEGATSIGNQPTPSRGGFDPQSARARAGQTQRLLDLDQVLQNLDPSSPTSSKTSGFRDACGLRRAYVPSDARRTRLSRLHG